MAIDDFSRELYAAILPDKTQVSARAFLEQVLKECPYTIEQYDTDNGKEYKGDPTHHAFMKLCAENRIEQRFTRVRNPKTNGKAERVIKTMGLPGLLCINQVDFGSLINDVMTLSMRYS